MFYVLRLSSIRVARARLDASHPAFDKLFLTYMIRHHNGAIAMVKDLFEQTGAGQDELVFKFANDVQVDQSTEVAREVSCVPTQGGCRSWFRKSISL